MTIQKKEIGTIYHLLFAPILETDSCENGSFTYGHSIASTSRAGNSQRQNVIEIACVNSTRMDWKDYLIACQVYKFVTTSNVEPSFSETICLYRGINSFLFTLKIIECQIQKEMQFYSLIFNFLIRKMSFSYDMWFIYGQMHKAEPTFLIFQVVYISIISGMSPAVCTFFFFS